MIRNDDYDADEILRENEDFVDDEDILEEEEPIEELDFENGRPERYNDIISDLESEEDLLE
ncbi:MAG: hypothetical protein GF401_08165 [Chitinivibrionales bacterium]|nr:hypothetical protein [Chitinivibrionales bacterium]